MQKTVFFYVSIKKYVKGTFLRNGLCTNQRGLSGIFLKHISSKSLEPILLVKILNSFVGFLAKLGVYFQNNCSCLTTLSICLVRILSKWVQWFRRWSWLQKFSKKTLFELFEFRVPKNGYFYQ